MTAADHRGVCWSGAQVDTSVLHACVPRYETDPMTKFLPQTETTVPIIRGPGEGRVVGVLRDQSTFKVTSEETGGAYAILEQKIPPGHGPPLHVHRHETEIFYVLEGEFEITIGDRKVA